MTAVVQRPERVTRQLGTLAREVAAVTPDRLEGGAASPCVWIDALPETVRLAHHAARRGASVVVSHAEPASWAALAEAQRTNDVPIVVGGPGVGSLAVARLMSALRAEKLGPLERLVIRAPGGRRVHPAASRRTAFGPDGRVRWDLDAASVARLAAHFAPLVRLAELLWPGSASRLAISELVPDEGVERVVAHARVDAASVCIELDREVRGDEELELEAVCARGTILVRSRDGREALWVRAPLRKEEHESFARPADELLVRHVLGRSADTPLLGSAREAALAYGACVDALNGASARRDARSLAIVLVHVPRYRNRFDELMLPSLAIARLAAYLRGHGFETRIVDLEAHFARTDLSAFVDDARVDAWLAGQADEAITAALERMWPALESALEGRCFVGFSIVDYFGHFQMNLASALARLVKERTRHPTVLGGERDQVDGDRAFTMQPAAFDYVVDGDGENALYELACLVADGDRDARFIEAVWSRSASGALVKNGIVRSHLNAMPRPDFEGIPLERYARAPSPGLLASLAREGLRPAVDPAPFVYLPYGFVKGCTADCTFCSAKEHLDVQAPEKTVDELLTLSARHGVRDFVFLDNLVNLGPRWLSRFCRLLIDSKAGLQWTDSCRPTGIDLELACLMREAGCLLLNYGAESGSDTVLARMQKGLTRADIVSTLRATHRAGIVNRVNLIAGYFHETPADVDLTISLVETLADEIDLIGCFQGFYLFPGMGVEPARENIVIREGFDRLKTGQLTLAYDEIGGLCWEEKRDIIHASRERILTRIEELGIRTIDKVDEHDLFWISRAFGDKAITRRHVLRTPEPAAFERAVLPPGGQRGRVVVER